MQATAAKRARKPTPSRAKKTGRVGSHHGLGPYSQLKRLQAVDRRLTGGWIVNQFRQDLLTHCGDDITPPEMMLVERACWTVLRIAMLDAKLASAKMFTEVDNAIHTSCTNSLIKLLNTLGLDPKSIATKPELDAITAEFERDAVPEFDTGFEETGE